MKKERKLHRHVTLHEGKTCVSVPIHFFQLIKYAFMLSEISYYFKISNKVTEKRVGMTTLKTITVKAIFKISLNIWRIYESFAFYTIVNFK